jgi:hypothetical protein
VGDAALHKIASDGAETSLTFCEIDVFLRMPAMRLERHPRSGKIQNRLSLQP